MGAGPDVDVADVADVANVAAVVAVDVTADGKVVEAGTEEVLPSPVCDSPGSELDEPETFGETKPMGRF